MLLEYYGLREQPFGVTPDPRFLFLSEKHQEAIAKLEFGIRCNRGFIVLIAPPGLGKTTLLYHMLETFRTSGDTSTAFVFQTQCTSIQLVRQLVNDLGIQYEGQDIVSMNQQLHHFLVQQANSGRKVVLFVDEAQNLSEEALETVRLLSNFETSSRKLLQIVLAGQPPLAAKLAKPSLHQLKQRVFAIARLKPLSTEEADAYILHRLSVAGGGSRSVFTPEARLLLIRSSKGIPREINALCFGALAVGYALRARSVDEAIARQSIMELTSNDLAAFDLIETSATVEDVAQPVTPKSMTTTSSEVPPVESVSHEPARQKSPGAELNASPDKDLDREAVAQIFQSAHISNRPEHARTRTIAMVAGVLFALLLSFSAIFYSAHLLSHEELATPAKTDINTETGTTPSASASLQPARSSHSERRQSRTHSLRKASPARVSADESGGRTESSDLQGQQFTSSVVAPALARLHESPASIITAMSTSNTPSSDSTESTDAEAGTALDSNVRAPVAGFSGNLRNESAEAAIPPTLGALIYSTTPHYPASARDERIEGTVVLKAVVAANGTVVRAERVSGSPALADAAIHDCLSQSGESPVETTTVCQVPALDLKAQYESIRPEIQYAINTVLDRQHFVLGHEVSALENEIAGVCERRFGVGVASGTDALILGLKALDIMPGDEVIVPAFSFIATADAVSMLGATPVFVDIDPKLFTLDPPKIRAAITPRTRAIIVVHLYGQTAEMSAILAIAAEHGLKVVEDTAQALGARYWGRPAAGMGDIGCISFFPSKNLGAYGDGGMVVTDSEATYARLKKLRAHGCAKKYISDELGWNSRLDELQAAILRVKLRHLDDWVTGRRERAALYTKLLSVEPKIVTPFCAEGHDHVYHQYTVKVPARKRVQSIVADYGITTTVYYPVSICLQPIYRNLGYKPGDLPETDRACESVLSLPIYPELTDAQQEYVADTLVQAVRTV